MISPGGIVQMGWVVTDLDAAAARFASTLGAGPFLVGRHIEVTDLRHRGVRAPTDFSFALAQAGNVQIELIEQHDDTPSVYRDMYGRGEEGFHHLAFIVPDVAAEVARYGAMGFEVGGDGIFGDSRFAYVDTHKAVGHMVELIPDSETIRALFSAVREAADDWDGRELIREIF
jgi:catechol 2,3-dioxygenase-like lactoylglutathione lyase family enzyme